MQQLQAGELGWGAKCGRKLRLEEEAVKKISQHMCSPHAPKLLPGALGLSKAQQPFQVLSSGKQSVTK